LDIAGRRLGETGRKDGFYRRLFEGLRRKRNIFAGKVIIDELNFSLGVPLWVGLSATIFFVRTLTKKIFATIPNATMRISSVPAKKSFAQTLTKSC
jgi:hypothetical protein